MEKAFSWAEIFCSKVFKNIVRNFVISTVKSEQNVSRVFRQKAFPFIKLNFFLCSVQKNCSFILTLFYDESFLRRSWLSERKCNWELSVNFDVNQCEKTFVEKWKLKIFGVYKEICGTNCCHGTSALRKEGATTQVGNRYFGVLLRVSN